MTKKAEPIKSPETSDAPHGTDRPAAPPKLTRFSWRLRLPQSKKEWAFSIIGVILALALLLLALPYSRYGLAGQLIKRPVTLDVVDARTHQPVSDVTIAVGQETFTTDAKGEVKIAAQPVGSWSLLASKKYYGSLVSSLMVPLFSNPKTIKLELTAIGNQVTVKVTNKITGTPLAKAKLAALGTTATTDAAGKAVIVLPATSTSVTGTIKLSGYNDEPIAIHNSETLSAANTFTLTPTGQIYYLDKRTGTINVMRANLDGTDPAVVVAGTGKESDTGTVLLAARDWNYLALLATRTTGQTGLYLINTATGKLSTIDQGSGDTTNITPVGWDGDSFIYTLSQTITTPNNSSQTSIKSLNATTGRATTLDQSAAQLIDTGVSISTSFSGIYIASDGSVVYAKFWDRFGYWATDTLSGKNQVFMKVSPDGTNKETLKTIDATQYQSVSTITNKPNQFDFQLLGSDSNGNSRPAAYYQYANGTLASSTTLNADDFSEDFYPTYLLSPSSTATLWYEPRDGKNTIFTGDQAGNGAKQIASLSDYTPYGWYGDDYILLSKNQSELYIAPKDMSSPPLKITDYHRPNVSFSGYGGGYGGQ